jgi:citrate lyase subunit beta/citryl-CoA lyase
MPGSNLRALAKAKALPADVLILDLEDSVAPDPERWRAGRSRAIAASRR